MPLLSHRGAARGLGTLSHIEASSFSWVAVHTSRGGDKAGGFFLKRRRPRPKNPSGSSTGPRAEPSPPVCPSLPPPGSGHSKALP